jgi:AcrR family transcriptional regulator
MDLDLLGGSVFSVLGEDYALPFEVDMNARKTSILMRSTVLFAMYGYASVSMKDLSAAIGIKSGSLYNHFDSKEQLWNEVVDHSERLYRLYHSDLDALLLSVNTLVDTLDVIFHEPEKMSNSFTCFAFSLIQSEQYRDERTWRVYRETFLDYPIGIISRAFDRCVKNGYAADFDTEATAASILHMALTQVNLYTQKLMGRDLTRDPREIIKRYHAHLLQTLPHEF